MQVRHLVEEVLFIFLIGGDLFMFSYDNQLILKTMKDEEYENFMKNI